MLFRRVICCSGGLYAVQVGYMEVVYCSGGLYDVQGGYMLFRGVICCSGGLYEHSVFRPIRGLEIQNGRQGAPKWNKITAEIMATMSLPDDLLMATDYNADHSCQKAC